MSEAGGVGRFQATREGFGFVTPDGGGTELYVPRGDTHGALHGDRVEYRVTRGPRGWRNAEAVVTRVVARGFARLTGAVGGTARRPHLIPDHPRLPPRLRLVGGPTHLEPGQRVLCELLDGGGRAGPGARPLEILGDAIDPALDAAIVETEFGLPGAYPADAAAEAERARRRLEARPMTGRRDFSRELVFTIDPADAADFDDAVSLARLDDGAWRLRVHIADVAAAVPRGGHLDCEARRRGNSTYLPGRMIPMLPESLATGLMSLSPGVPKRVLTVSARLGQRGRLLGARIDEGWIVSRCRLDYDRVQATLEGGAGPAPEITAALREMDALARALRARRMRRGAFDLEVPETEIILDARGVPRVIRRRRQERSHQLIEEFMILANRIACGWAIRRGHPYLFRVHDAPEPAALEEFVEEVRALAPEVRGLQLRDLPAIRRWLAGLPREPRTWRIHALFLRSLRRAAYAPDDRGHFGLGIRGYGHFTSPIRRYPDLFNHRVIRWALRHGRRPVPDEWRAEARSVAELSTGTEERSERAERELVRIKCLRWAEDRLGACFRATLTGRGRAGYFVELDEVPVEGLVPRSEAADDPDARRGGLQPGDPLVVQIARVDLRERVLLLAIRAAGRRALTTDPAQLEGLVDPWGDRPRPGPRRRAPGRRESRRTAGRGERRGARRRRGR